MSRRNDGAGQYSATATQPNQAATDPAHNEKPKVFEPTIEMMRWHILRPLAEGQLALANMLHVVSSIILTHPDDPAGKSVMEELTKPLMMPNFGQFYPPPNYEPNLFESPDSLEGV